LTRNAELRRVPDNPQLKITLKYQLALPQTFGRGLHMCLYDGTGVGNDLSEALAGHFFRAQKTQGNQ
jgi:hypothetical protein